MNFPNEQRARYVRVPIPLKRESNFKSSFSFGFKGLIDLHKKSIEREKKKLGVSSYGMIWISFFRGLLVAFLVERLIFN